MLMTEQAQMESESKRCEYLCPQGQPRSSSIPLLLLVKQILKVRLSQNGFLRPRRDGKCYLSAPVQKKVKHHRNYELYSRL